MTNVMGLLTASLILASSPAWGYTFGYPGDNGDRGRKGADGRDGREAVAVADGTVADLDLRGAYGGDGTDGRRGDDARSCYQPTGPNNEHGAYGGNGGDGGDGGNGGNGGNVTVYYDSLANLRQIQVDSTPGEGGSAGFSGQGGRACRCSRTSWTYDDRTYTCRDGTDGPDGRFGFRGSRGVKGKARLIGQLDPLPAEMPRLRTTLGLIDVSAPTISKHAWATRDGATALFAPGSRIDDRYTTYTRTDSASFHLTWSSPRPLTEFDAVGVELAFDGAAPKATVDDDAWLIATQRAVADGVDIEVTDAMLRTEASGLAIGAFSGVGRNLVLTFTDPAPENAALRTALALDFYTRGAVVWRQRWTGRVAAEHVTRSGDQVTVAIGHLNIDPYYLQDGTTILVDLWATRTFGTHSTQLTYSKQHEI